MECYKISLGESKLYSDEKVTQKWNHHFIGSVLYDRFDSVTKEAMRIGLFNMFVNEDGKISVNVLHER